VDADGQASHYKMYVEDYVKYPRKLEGHSDSDNGDYSFAHRGQDKVSHVISDIRNTVFYMIDFDMPRLLVKFYSDFDESFKMKECLP